MTYIKNSSFDAERAFYAARGTTVEDCVFAGPADGESAFKESRDIAAMRTRFELRYPFWHDERVRLEDCVLTETCRAAFWYTRDVAVARSALHGVKMFRECFDVSLDGCDVVSPEFGWRCRNLRMADVKATGEYFLFGSVGVEAERFELSGKYSFQYCKDVVIRDSVLNTKDAFWHTENVTVYDSVVNGEYLGWYSKNLRLVRCKLSGTQPMCYAEGLVLEDCTTEGCDLSFEYSDVCATVSGDIMSVKNPASGSIVADSIGEIILDEHRRDTVCEITLRK